MSVTVKYINAPANDAEPITANFEDWVKTLSDAEQAAVRVVQHKVGLQRKILVEIGKLQVTYDPELTFTWATSASADAGVPTVAEWEAIQARYCAANNAKVTTVRT